MLPQASGEAIYTLDTPGMKDGLWACYVASQHPLACFDSVDVSQALALPGVLDFVGAKDIPKAGKNSTLGQEAVFAEGKVEWVGQHIGLIVAETRAAAERGAQLVEVSLIACADSWRNSCLLKGVKVAFSMLGFIVSSSIWLCQFADWQVAYTDSDLTHFSWEVSSSIHSIESSCQAVSNVPLDKLISRTSYA